LAAHLAALDPAGVPGWDRTALGTAAGWLVPRLNRGCGIVSAASGPQGPTLAFGWRF